MKKRWRLLWRVFAASFLIAIVTLGAATFASWAILEDFAIRSETDMLARLARLGSIRAAGTMADGGAGEPCTWLAGLEDIECSLIAPDGTVLRDSATQASEIPNQADRPEVRRALSGQTGQARRFSLIHREHRLYAAHPVLDENGRVLGVFRVSISANSIENATKASSWAFLQVFLVLSAIAAVACYLFARGFTAPIAVMRRGAERFGRGQLEYRIPALPTIELSELADALNRMAEQLQDRIVQITRDSTERDAILSSMREGLLAIDKNEAILAMNPVAERLFGISDAEARGKLVQEVLRVVELQRLIAAALEAEEPLTPMTTTVRIDELRLIEAEVSALRDEKGQRIGLLMMLIDVTRIHQLEEVRREFVANVSHELRTPITSIKGFAETLLDGALDDTGQARRFVEIIERQAQRLGDVIEDLLNLSRIERLDQIERQECAIQTILDEAVELCQAQAAGRQTAIDIECAPGLAARVNSILIVQALANLLDNAIKYGGGSDSSVTVRARAGGIDLELEVSDNGPGIAKEHLPRLFERFYRIDKARSRSIGGTGLGLAIVKRVAEAHGGHVSVESTPGTGSLFRIVLPGAVLRASVSKSNKKEMPRT